MPSNWEQAPLGDLVDDILDRRGVTPIKLGSRFCSSGHRVVSAKLVKCGRFDLSADTPRFIDSTTYEKWMRTSLLADDVILTSEAPLGETAYLRTPIDWALGQRLFAIRTKKDRLHGRFLYYSLQCGAARTDLISRATGTTVHGIRQSELRRVRVCFPAITEQRAIAHILGTLDDKIDLNRRTNETLEAMARALFKSWFVDFDPVHAKAAGRQPSGMDAAMAALFPSEFVESELGRIPKGWRVATLGDTCNITMGQSPPGESYNEEGRGQPFYQGSTDFGFRFPTRRVFCTAPTRFARRGDTLLSVRAPVGARNMAIEDCAIGRGLAAIRHRTSSPSLTFHLLGEFEADFQAHEASGTVFGSINKAAMHALRHVEPDAKAVALYGKVAEPCEKRLECLHLESLTLASLRDALLPRLLSGELAIPDAERFVEAAT